MWVLGRSVDYLLGALRFARGAAPSSPTPCAGWDLRTLLGHLDDSLDALAEAAGRGRVALEAEPGSGSSVDGLRERARALPPAWSGVSEVTIGGVPVEPDVVLAAGSIELAVHGWDVATACGVRGAMPDDLALALWQVAPTLVTKADRPWRFAEPVPVSAGSGTGDRLLAFLGRVPL